MKLKENILKLKEEGLKQFEIARSLNCSSSTVSYHCNPLVKKKIIEKKRIRRILTKKDLIIHPFIDKEIEVEPKNVNWKVAEAICNAKLIELGYETFIPFNGNGEIDIIAHKDDSLYRIQIKSVSPNGNAFDVDLSRNGSNGTRIPYENIDLFLIYDGTNIYRISKNQLETRMTFRYKIPINMQIDNIKMARDYIFQ